MECRQAKIKFSRQLKCDEQEKLIGHFKGLILAMKDSLKKKIKNLGMAKLIGAKLGNNMVELAQNRMNLMLAETTKDGITTCEYERLFSLDWEQANPAEWNFIYPHPQSLFGTAEFSKILRGLKITSLSDDEAFIKGILNEAKLMHITDKIEITLIERESHA